MIRHLRTGVLGRVGLATVLTLGVMAAGIGVTQGVAYASSHHHHGAEHGRKANKGKDKSKDRMKVVGVVSSVTAAVTSTSAGTTTTVTPGTLTLIGPGGIPMSFDLSSTTAVSGPGDQQNADTLASIMVGQRVRVVVSMVAPLTTPPTAASVRILESASNDH